MASISIAKEFSPVPGPRYRDEGDWSGQQFREDLLKPRFLLARSAGETLTIDLDGLAGYPGSFLEEAFGGLAREEGIEAVSAVLRFKCQEEPMLNDEIAVHIAKCNQKKREPVW